MHSYLLLILSFQTGSEYGSGRADASLKPTKERLTDLNVQSINQQPLHRGGRSNPNQYVYRILTAYE